MNTSSNDTTRRVGIEITGSAIVSVLLGADGAVEASRIIPRDRGTDTVAEVASLLDGLRSEHGDIRKVGIAVPGLVDASTGRVAFSANIPMNERIDLSSQVKGATGLEVVIENDANAAAYGEFVMGAGRGSKNLFYATLGEGVGGAFIFDGELWRGAAGFAGEFGYVPINSEGMRLEEVASSEGIIRRTRSRFHHDNTSSLNRLVEEDIALADIISAADSGDDFAQMMLARTGNYVGTGVAIVINLVNVERIVIGGEIMSAKHFVLDAVLERARELSFAPAFQSTSIVEGSLGSHAAAVGVACLAGV